MEDDKPFACSIPDCKMTFTNEDHLTVHKQKHELSLGLTPTTAFKTSFFDQTPTPTRFFNTLETDLFNELHNDNPFDVTFRRANSLVAANGEIPVMSENTLLSTGLSNLEPLNTPSIILPSEEPPPSAKTKSVISLKQPTPRIEINSNTVSQTLSSFSPEAKELTTSNNVKVTDGTKLEDKTASSTNLSLDGDKLAQAFEQTIRDTVVQTPVITSVGNLMKANATCVPTAVVVTRTCTNNAPTLTSSISQIPVMSNSSSQSISANNTQKVSELAHVPSVLQFVIRLSDGQSMPISLPLAIPSTVASTPSSQITNNIKPVSNINQIPSAPQSLAKKKLKEVLKSQQKLPKSSNVVMEGTSAAVVLNNSTFFQNESESPPSSPISVGRPSSSGRRRRTADDPEERRKKSLERNRAAATRCRQKRKQWISSLESKATEMAKLNLQLQQEVTMLRKEVAQLKTMLLAHKDCPVTQQQAASGLIEVPMVNHTAQREVPQISISSVPLIELMDVETSSSQSGYISDTSEISTRDR